MQRTADRIGQCWLLGVVHIRSIWLEVKIFNRFDGDHHHHAKLEEKNLYSNLILPQYRLALVISANQQTIDRLIMHVIKIIMLVPRRWSNPQ